MLTGRRYGGTPARSCPARTMRPAFGSSKPASIRSSVLLPQPDGPEKAEELAARRCRASESSTATVPPNRLATVSKRISGTAAGSFQGANERRTAPIDTGSRTEFKADTSLIAPGSRRTGGT